MKATKFKYIFQFPPLLPPNTTQHVVAQVNGRLIEGGQPQRATMGAFVKTFSKNESIDVRIYSSDADGETSNARHVLRGHKVGDKPQVADDISLIVEPVEDAAEVPPNESQDPSINESNG